MSGTVGSGRVLITHYSECLLQEPVNVLQCHCSLRCWCPLLFEELVELGGDVHRERWWLGWPRQNNSSHRPIRGPRFRYFDFCSSPNPNVYSHAPLSRIKALAGPAPPEGYVAIIGPSYVNSLVSNSLTLQAPTLKLNDYFHQGQALYSGHIPLNNCFKVFARS